MRKALLLILCAAMIVTMAACGDAPTETPETTVAPTEATAAPAASPTEAPTEEETEPAPTPEEIYAQAIARMEELDSMTMEISYDLKTTLGNQTFTEKSSQTLVLQNIGMDSFSASLQDTTYMGIYCIKTRERFIDGKMYYSVTPTGSASMNHVTSMTAEEFLDRMIPGQLLDVQLYETVELSDGQLIFSDASGLEEWLGEENGVLTEASGTVGMDENGRLSESTYSVTYKLGSADIAYQVSVKISDDAGEAITVPADAKGYQVLEEDAYLGPYLIQHAIGYINQMDTIYSVETEEAFSAATGWSHLYQETVNTYIAPGTQLAKMDYVYQMADLYTGEYYYDDVIGETYENGVYTYTYNDEKPEQYQLAYTVLSDTILEDNLRAIPYQDHVESYEVGNYSGVILVEYQLSDEVDKEMSTGVAGLMFAEADALDNMASAYRTEEASGYIGIDAATGIPTALGFDYTGVHTIEGEEYQLIYSLTRTFMVGQPSVYETIKGEPLEVEEDTEGATPLFYKVTGADGQQMWLLGTIHIGDGRTAELPQEIWEAFDASDALALEYNSEAFSEQMEADEAFAAQIWQLYFYEDGSTTEEHISDPEVYEFAMKRMKATGLLNGYTETMKAMAWYQDITNYNDQWNYALSSDEGMDKRLEERAREQGKEIREVESGLSQISMLYGFSDGVQEMLLASALSSTPVEDMVQTNELYELWCAGDEAELFDYLYGEDESESEGSEDDESESAESEGEEPESAESESDGVESNESESAESEPTESEGGETEAAGEEMTEEEKLLYEEYEKAMETDRNAAMLEVAKGYLESGDVVFYAVGLAHLIAEDGLVNTLRDAGYTVELVPYS